MVYMVILKLDEESYGSSGKESQAMVSEAVIPSLKKLRKLEKEGKVKGGFFNGQRAGALMIDATSDEDLDKILSDLPIWGVFDFEVVKLESFQEAQERDEKIVKNLKAASGQ